MFDRSKPYGEVYGHDHARYYQDGIYYTGNGTEIGKHPDAPAAADAAPAPKGEEKPDHRVRLAALMGTSAQRVFDAAAKLAGALPDLKYEPKPPGVGDANAQAEAKRQNAEFVARNSD